MKIKFGKKESKHSSDDFLTKLLTIVLPIAFQQFMLSLVSASDALMLGKLTQDSLSAVSLASQVAFVENLFLAAMTIGLSIFAAQYWGKKDIAAVGGCRRSAPSNGCGLATLAEGQWCRTQC